MSTAWDRQMRGTYRGTPPQGERLALPFVGTLTAPEPPVIVERLQASRYGFTHYERGWIHGTWYCGTRNKPASYWGQFPGQFVERIHAMFPVERMLHLCSGHLHIGGAVNVDVMPTPARDVQADVAALPFADASFAVVLIDPPYSQEDAQRYGVRRLIRSRAAMSEARRVLAGGGICFGWTRGTPPFAAPSGSCAAWLAS